MPFHHDPVERPLAQFDAYQASRSLRAAVATEPVQAWLAAGSGAWLARLLAHDVRVVQRFDDHAWVAERLAAAGEFDTLFRVAASGLLHGMALRFYRLALAAWLDA